MMFLLRKNGSTFNVKNDYLPKGCEDMWLGRHVWLIPLVDEHVVGR